MASNFRVEGPFSVSRTAKPGGKVITVDDVKDFWLTHPELGEKTGCYVFVRRAGRGYTAGYVGKATKSFKQEVFTGRNLSLYHSFLMEYRNGTPMVFFVVSGARKSGKHDSHITDLEEFLIQSAVRVNPNLMNVRGTSKQQWSISGVIRSGSGGHSHAAGQFKQALKLQK